MALIEWRSDFETGVADVDHEHKELVDLINQLHAQLGSNADADTVSAFLGEVFARISAHFALEETIMRKHGYDEYAEHKQDHEKLLDDIRDIMDDHEAGDYAAYDEALASAVRDWFVNHFKTKDARPSQVAGRVIRPIGRRKEPDAAASTDGPAGRGRLLPEGLRLTSCAPSWPGYPSPCHRHAVR